MTTHPSHPDLLMSRMLGVCWHSPTSDRWPCTATDPRLCNDPEQPTHGSYVLPLNHLTPWHRDDEGAEWKSDGACELCGHPETDHVFDGVGCNILDCDCDRFEGPEAPYEPSTTCDGDPIECNAEAALGEAEEKLRRVRDAIAEFEARAEAAKYQSTVVEEDEATAMVEWGRYYGYTQAAKFLREALS